VVVTNATVALYLDCLMETLAIIDVFCVAYYSSGWRNHKNWNAELILTPCLTHIASEARL
jgi:hypothetical protein